MDEALIGYARCSTDEQDLTAQRQALHALGVPPDRVYIDHGISGTKRERPGLDQALAAVRTGDTLVVPKLDRLARSVPDARDIGDTLAKRGVSLSLGVQIYADHEALIRIDDGGTIRGDLPRTAARLVEQWRALHQDELLANWLLAQEPAALSGIDDEVFAEVAVDAVAGTIYWSNGIDLDPDVLHGDDASASIVQPQVVREYRLQQTS